MMTRCQWSCEDEATFSRPLLTLFSQKVCAYLPRYSMCPKANGQEKHPELSGVSITAVRSPRVRVYSSLVKTKVSQELKVVHQTFIPDNWSAATGNVSWVSVLENYNTLELEMMVCTTLHYFRTTGVRGGVLSILQICNLPARCH